MRNSGRSCVVVCFGGYTNVYLFYQLAVVLFDLNADRCLRELFEHILQQSKLPVCATAVAT